MKVFIQGLFRWLTQPPLAMRVIQSALDTSRQECKEWRDLFVQQLELNRVIPRQPEHRGPPSPPQEQRKSLGELQAEYLEEEQRRYERYVAEEEAMIRGDESEAKPS